MRNAINKRWLILLPALAVSAWLALQGNPTETPTVVANVRRGRAPASATPVSPAPTRAGTTHAGMKDVEALIPRAVLFPGADGRSARRNLFAARSWLAPAPAVKQTTPLPAPVAAPTYTYVGMQFDGSVWEVYLSRNERTYIVRQGSVIDDAYRVEDIAPPELTLRDLGTQQTYTLAIGAAP